MTKDQAIYAMQIGRRVTHPLMLRPDQYFYSLDGVIIFDETGLNGRQVGTWLQVIEGYFDEGWEFYLSRGV